MQQNQEFSKIWLLESGIHNDGIWNPDLIWNPKSKEVRNRNPEGQNPGSCRLESGTQNLCGFCYMGQKVSSDAIP